MTHLKKLLRLVQLRVYADDRFALKKDKKNMGTFVVRVLVALAVAIIDQDGREMREQSICRQVGPAYSQPLLAARWARVSVAFPLNSTFKVFCMGKLKFWCIRKVKIHCVKLFLCILFWKDEFNYKVCELVEVGVQNFCTLLKKVLVMFVGSNAFPAGVEEESDLLGYDAVYVGTHTYFGGFYIL